MIFCSLQDRVNVNEVKHKVDQRKNVVFPENKTDAFLSDLDKELKERLKAYCQRDYDMFYSDF